MRVYAAGVLVLALSVPAGAAQKSPVTKVFEEFGLFGTWAADCTRAPAVDNAYATVIRPAGSGPVIEKDDAGPAAYVNRYTIVSAKRLSDDTLSVRTVYRVGSQEKQIQDQIWFVRDDRWRTLFNQPKGAAALVKDGNVVGSGIKTPILHRCDGASLKRPAIPPSQTRRFPG
ncbi:MAG TPA: hypothetical protein VFS63_13000 [Pseudolabrys sp.]|jgi:hypothetical protein|nr:hypothetical protein [Pseudolabrys sp.]